MSAKYISFHLVLCHLCQFNKLWLHFFIQVSNEKVDGNWAEQLKPIWCTTLIWWKSAGDYALSSSFKPSMEPTYAIQPTFNQIASQNVVWYSVICFAPYYFFSEALLNKETVLLQWTQA